MSSKKIKLNWVRFFLQPRFTSYFGGHFSNKRKNPGSHGAATSCNPERSLVWNRAQPEDTTQMRCQCIITTECLILPRAVCTVTVAPHQGFGTEAPHPGAAAGLAGEQGDTCPAWTTEVCMVTSSQPEQLGPAYVPSKILQDEFLLSYSFIIITIFFFLKPHFQ